jgi:POT family proton-dependent oligopeptide transporter
VFFAMIILGYFGQNRHWSLSYVIAGLIQLVGLIPFTTASKSSLLCQSESEFKKEKISLSLPKLHKNELHRIFVILILALFSIIFWMAYNQGGSSMNLFALRYTDRELFGFTMPPSWLLASESIYLVILAFPLAYLYKFLSDKKKDPTPPMKCALSLIFIGLCFLIMSLGSRKIAAGAETAALSPYYLLSAYALMALGEMLICPIGLSLITHISPHKYTAMLVGIWYFCIGIAFYLGGVFAGYMSEFKISEFFNVFVATSFISAIALLLLVKRLNQLRHLHSL